MRINSILMLTFIYFCCVSKPKIPNPPKVQSFAGTILPLWTDISKITPPKIMPQCYFTESESEFFIGQELGISNKKEAKDPLKKPKNSTGFVQKEPLSIRNWGKFQCLNDAYLSVIHSSEKIGELHLLYPDFQTRENPILKANKEIGFPSSLLINFKIREPDGFHHLCFIYTIDKPSNLFDSDIWNNVDKQVLYSDLANKHLIKLKDNLSKRNDFQVECIKYKVMDKANFEKEQALKQKNKEDALKNAESNLEDDEDED